MFVPYTFSVRVLFAVLAVIQPSTGQNPPTWNTGTSFTKTSSDCPEITDLSATSQTGDTVEYSVVSQTPNAGFTIDVNFASDPILTCVAGDVSQSSYVVVVRAKYQSDQGQSDLTIAITFTDQSPATWNTGTSHTLDKTDANACNSVTTLSATSTDGSTVTYSIQGSSVFTITGSNILSCTLGDITLSSYTVVVRANQDNNVPTDITLTITVTGLSDEDECLSDPCENNGNCTGSSNGYTCSCQPGYGGERCQNDIDECLSDPCENNGNCTGSSNGYTCSCQPGYGGERCQNDIDECLSQPCKNNGACVNAINGFVCSCDQGYEGYRCQNEIGDQTTLIVVLISSICVLSIVVLATVCCCLRYRREHKKTKLGASNVHDVLNSGKMQNTKEVKTVSKEKKEGHFNTIVNDEIKDNREVETVSKEMKEEHFDEIVYEEIKDNTEADVADYIYQVTDVEQPKDADGYLKYVDNDQTVGYYKLKHTKTDDYTKLKHTKTDDYTTLSGCES